MQYSEHFDSSEFDHDAPIPAECEDVAKQFCQLVLEPIRAFIGGPMQITSGYRPTAANAATHGATHSEHIWTARAVATDFTFAPKPGLSTRAVFDWIRNNPTIPFHQVILEADPSGSSIIHVSMNLSKPGIRQALIGATHNAMPYSTADVVPFDPDGAASA